MADTPDDLRRLAREICDAPPTFFSMDVLHEAADVAHHDPAALTDRHLQHIAVYQPKTILALLQKRAAAVQRRANQALAAANAHAAEQRRAAAVVSAPAVPAIDAAALDAMSPEEICQKFPDTPVTLGMWGELLQFFEIQRTKNLERNARLDALETRAAAAEQRAADLAKQLIDFRVEVDADRQVRR